VIAIKKDVVDLPEKNGINPQGSFSRHFS